MILKLSVSLLRLLPPSGNTDFEIWLGRSFENQELQDLYDE